MLVSLNKHGIELRAVTRQDFTEYLLHGPASKGDIIEEAAVAILARSQLPSWGFETEIESILLEFNADSSYVSRGAYFEQYAALHHGTPPPCLDDPTPLKNYSHANVQDYYDAFYTQGNISILSVGPASELDVSRVAAKIEASRPEAGDFDRYVGERLSINGIQTGQFPGTLEVLFAVPGRDALPHYLAQRFSESLRLELQALLRSTPNAYQAGSIVHQSLKAGWISLTARVSKTSKELDSEFIKKFMLVVIDEYRFTIAADEVALVENIDVAVSPELLDQAPEIFYRAAVAEMARESISVTYVPHPSQASSSRRYTFLFLAFLGLLGLFISLKYRRQS
jgi:hypothetical protein